MNDGAVVDPQVYHKQKVDLKQIWKYTKVCTILYYHFILPSPLVVAVLPHLVHLSVTSPTVTPQTKIQGSIPEATLDQKTPL